MNNPQRFRSQGGMLENHVSNNVSLFNPMKMQLHLDALQILLRNNIDELTTYLVSQILKLRIY